ncbi:hypothetical protein [Necropsobacter rosorum]|uniref:hypothetical protein n=1 Tax=Necropsobacter rosorum TaxID=908285 RepID=UPI003C7CD198
MKAEKQEADHKKRLSKIIGFRADEAFYQQIKLAADKERRSISQLVRILVEDYLAK